MKKIIVSKQAVREYIREIMTPTGVGMGWQATGDLSTSPVGVSAVVDPSAAQVDPGNPNFKPRNRKELQSAISCMVDDISDDNAADFYDALQDTKNLRDKEDEKMKKDDKKDDKKVEETIRKAIRNILKEAVKKTPTFTVTNPHGVKPTVYPPGTGVSLDKLKKSLHKSIPKMTAAENNIEKREKEAAEQEKKEKQNVVGSRMSLAQYSAATGDKPATAQKAGITGLGKVHAAFKDIEAFDEIYYQTLSNYIDDLINTGEIGEEDAQFLEEHPKMLEDSETYMNDYLKPAWDSYLEDTGIEFDVPMGDLLKRIGVKESVEMKGSKCTSCSASISDSDKKSFKKAGGNGEPKVCAACVKKED